MLSDKFLRRAGMRDHDIWILMSDNNFPEWGAILLIGKGHAWKEK